MIDPTNLPYTVDVVRKYFGWRDLSEGLLKKEIEAAKPDPATMKGRGL